MRFPTRGAARWPWIVAVAVLSLAALIASTQVCLSAGFSTGLWLDECPDGELRQTINVYAPNLSRGAKSRITVRTNALYTTGGADTRFSEAITKLSPALVLVSPSGAEAPLNPVKEWEKSGSGLAAEIELPKVDDGDYLLRTTVTSTVGTSKLDLPLPLYAPARIHVLTDRPLYEPGNVVRFRAIVLRSTDLSPLDNRPGTWRVTDAQGTVLLEEKAPAGAWGVVTGSFPLDKGAESGTWNVAWASGGAEGSRSFSVKPFTLPRFTVEASPERPFYRRNERPVLKGEVKYSSGAPVANAKLELDWDVVGEWPPPPAWAEGEALPKAAITNAAGTFSVALPAVPEDLRKQVRLEAAIGAVDPSGDRVEGSATVLLAEDAIDVTAVSELQEGLVEGFNNRLYLRATTADGQLLEGVTLNVKRLWEPTDKGTDAPVDEDGVASLQIDPGPPVNVVIPAMPFRPPPKESPVESSGVQDYLAEDGEVALADRLAFDRVQARLGPCARYMGDEGGGVVVGVLVSNGGEVVGRSRRPGKLGECVDDALKGLRFEAGRQRLFEASWQFNDNDIPRLEIQPQGVPPPPEPVLTALQAATFAARDCLPPTVRSGTLPKLLFWKYEPGAKELKVQWGPNPQGQKAPEGAMGCIEGRLAHVKLPKQQGQPAVDEDEGEEGAAGGGSVGVATFQVYAPEKYEAERPQDTVMTGYEFLVSAKRKGAALGSTKLLLRPGAVPNIRLRASSQLLSPGGAVTVELLRGPDFNGDLPEKLYLTQGYRSVEAKVDKEKRTATFELPKDLEGWAMVEWLGARVFLFVQPKATLKVALKPEKPRYAPGQVAQLGVETTIGGQGGPAAVGLFGVDQSLGQLAPLPGSDELAGLRPQASSVASFGSLDAQALSLGRIRGANAAAATLLRVSALPPPPEVETAVTASGETVFDPNETLVDRFYVVLQELHVQAREWESSAPAAEKMSPRTMAGLWNKAIDAVERRKESARDAWGRKLRLHRLPADLLSLTEPRAVVVAGTRLPEDTENWSAWVAKEKP